jgi:predicted transcriptional regulator of viral defense system
MLPEDVLTRTGGVAPARLLVDMCGRRAVQVALDAGTVTRTARGRYALAHADAALQAAHGLKGVISHLSAARWWGWEVKTQPDRPWVTVPHDRKNRGTTNARLSFRDLPAHDVTAPGVTTPMRTVLDCATQLPFDEALAIADSALRHRAVQLDELIQAAEASSRYCGRSRWRPVAGDRSRVVRLAR